MKLQFLSKAQTLEGLAKVLDSACVLPQIRFFAKEYFQDGKSILEKCLKEFKDEVIVRSSSSQEDMQNGSYAGKFVSVADVILNQNALDAAILKVIKSYGDELSKDDEVFIQPMLKNVSMSGVVFTADIDTLSPYYIINYDESGSTSNVTGGNGKSLKTLVIFKTYNYHENHKIASLIKACRECEMIFGNSFLDIEFAFVDGELYILQVRPIVQTKKSAIHNINLEDSLEKLYKKIKKLNTSHPKLLGHKSIFGVMPDWNPAEIIGIRPKALSLSLYKEIITNEIWAYQRDNYGYRNLRSFPLLVSFLGVPYIDVRVSFNSFIPKNLHDSIALKLVDHYLEQLAHNRNYHDKIEFEIVYSCYYFGIEKKLIKLKEKYFSDNEIKRIEFELLELTNGIIDSENGLYKKDLMKVELLEEKYEQIVQSNLSVVDKIYWLIEDCKRYGTLPFAGVARAAFVAIQFLNSFVDEGIITDEEKNNFLNSIETISKKLNYDKESLIKEDFLCRYGHLRPGTYDICSARYDETYDEYFSDAACNVNGTGFIFSKTQIEMMEELIIQHGLKCDSNGLITFIIQSIEGREYAKFAFTKHLSKILSYIEEFGYKLGLFKEDLAHLDIHQIKDLYAALDHRNVKEIFQKDIEKNKILYNYTQAVKLPSIIVDEKDIYCYEIASEEANFVTLKTVTGKVIDLDSSTSHSFEGKIICINAADPGYDYLFSKNIGGLITCYGGANSHMTIRCAELGIPAAIGCGENMFERYRKATLLTIDAMNKQVKIIA